MNLRYASLKAFCRPVTFAASLLALSIPAANAASQLKMYPVPAEVASSHFRVRIDGHATDVLHAATGYYLLNFDTVGPVTVSVTADDPHFWDAGVEVQPMRLGIRPVRKGATITFPMLGPSKLTITRPGDHFADADILFLFANPIDHSNITAATPKVRYYGSGVHHENIDAQSGDTIYLAGGAVIFGSLNLWQVHDVHVLGTGTLIYDGPQDPYSDTGWMHKKNWHVIVMDNATNIEIDGITAITRSRSWQIQMRDSRHIGLYNIKAIGGNPNNANQDGIDWLGGGDTTIRNSFFRASDDVFAAYGNWDGYEPALLKQPRHDVTNITIEDTIASTSISNIVRIAWPEKTFNSAHFHMSDVDVIHAGYGGCKVPFAFFELWADPDGHGSHTDYRFTNIRMDDWYSLFNIEQPNAAVRDISFTNVWAMDGPGMVRPILKGDVSGVTLTGATEQGFQGATADVQPGTAAPTIKPAAIDARFTYTSGFLKPNQPIDFIADAPDAQGRRFEWIFGDGMRSEGRSVHHTFPDSEGTLLDHSGRFRVVLHINDASGEQSWNTEQVVLARQMQPPPAPGNGTCCSLKLSTVKVHIPSDGGYTFTLLTSLNAFMSIDHQTPQASPTPRPQVCGSPGNSVQPMRISVALTAGDHEVYVLRQPGFENAQSPSGPPSDQPLLLWEGPGIDRQPIPPIRLRRGDPIMPTFLRSRRDPVILSGATRNASSRVAQSKDPRISPFAPPVLRPHENGTERQTQMPSGNDKKRALITQVEERTKRSKYQHHPRSHRSHQMNPAIARRTATIQIIGTIALSALTSMAAAQTPLAPAVLTAPPISVAYGPYNAHILQGGLGLTKNLHERDALAAAQRGWSMSLWFKSDEPSQTAFVAGVGRPWESSPRYLALKDGKPAFWAGGMGEGHELVGTTALATDTWHSLAVFVDDSGKTHLYADGSEVASGTLALGVASSVVVMAPTEGSMWPGNGASVKHFGGLLAQVSLHSTPLAADALAAMTAAPAGLDNLPYEEGSRPWPFQTQGPSGLVAPQDPSLLPHSNAPALAPKAIAPLSGNDEASKDGSTLILRHGWQLADAADVKSPGPEFGPTLAASSYDASKWMAAVVPGTVLTTLIARGVYPDPDFGLDNMAIPESLAKHTFWYRNTFTPPAAMRGRKLTMTFHGINYRATIFINGTRVGEILGAFRHKQFDVSSLVKAGEKNTLAVYIEPPFHTGIAHEQSLAAGSGDNGGVMMLDGPTFGATEGWDWIPGIRDRNMGIWQDVALTASGAVEIAVPQIITHVPDTSKAEITIRVPLANDTKAAVKGTVEIAFDDVHISKSVTVAPGGTTVELTPKEFPQLNIQHPRLWWPNGYGAPELHTMKLTFKSGSKVSDTRDERFGIRELTYELSAFDATGHVRRVEASPTEATLIGKGAVISQTHEGFRETPDGWVTSIAPGMEDSPALKADPDTKLRTALVIKVNGVRIAVKGGAWGMDDMLKRVGRERLEPFFRLHREANVNTIRNWMGQDTEDIFFDLADEYGMLVWSDFWASTQGWNLEPDDSGLFLDNARDVISRYRNHPSIAVWCGRNEGVPPPTINKGLAKLTTELDGTRYYSADSNKINLHDSGPYKYQEPEDYFTKLSLGFAVEVGIASPPTLEAMQAMMPREDQWPISDAWAYHDWHQGGNGATEPFVETLNQEFGPATSLADFDRKAQMINYEAHRAIFEGFNAHLWKPNSGRLLWMTQPAWPSTEWQILSHDYDTHASYYAVKKAAEPVHVQLDLPTHSVSVINNTLAPLTGVTVTARVFDTMSKPLLGGSNDKTATVTAAPNAETEALTMDLQSAFETVGTVLIKLELKDAAGKLLSDNFYWLAANKSDYRRMDEMPAATLTTTAKLTNGAPEQHATITLTNSGTEAALAAKLTLKDAATGDRILPAYYSDNYVSLLPGETKVIDIAIPATAAKSSMKVDLRGWNVTPSSTPLTQ